MTSMTKNRKGNFVFTRPSTRHLMQNLALLAFGTLLAFSGVHGSGAEEESGRPVSLCAEIAGLASHLQPGRILLLGEMHGTVEAPRFVHDTICAALDSGLAVTVALEIPHGESSILSAYKESNDTPADALEILRASEFWNTPDGRSSQAVLELIERIHQWQEADRPLELVLFDDPRAKSRDLAMADRIAKASKKLPDSLVVVLTGNIHNRMTAGISFDEDYEPMGFILKTRLSERTIISLNLTYAGGEAWNCMGECKINSLPVANNSLERKIVMKDWSETSVYHGFFHIGKATASLPALMSPSVEAK